VLFHNPSALRAALRNTRQRRCASNADSHSAVVGFIEHLPFFENMTQELVANPPAKTFYLIHADHL
jgi:hypothetical protein